MILVHTLAFNLFTEVEKATQDLYEQCGGQFDKHIIADVGFPIFFDGLPKSVSEAQETNSVLLQGLAKKFGSEYVKIDNIGVSQNWNQVIMHSQIESGCVICADPDERTKTKGWVKAIADVFEAQPKMAWVSLNTDAHEKLAQNGGLLHHKVKYGHDVYSVNGCSNWAQGGFNMDFLNEIGGVPVPNGGNSIYGWLEHASYQRMAGRWGWCILKDFYVEHTENSTLYREWKNYVVFEKPKEQVSFADYLIKVKGVKP
jgi:hypothetical protein